TESIKIDIRLVAATNKDLRREVDEGRFRRDLYYRLRGYRIRTQALREHPTDIPIIIREASASRFAETSRMTRINLTISLFGAEKRQRDFSKMFGRLAPSGMLAEDWSMTAVGNHPKGRLRNSFVHFQRKVHRIQRVPVTMHD